MKKKKNTRKTHSAEFKARIAMEAVRGLKTVSDIDSENQVHPVQVRQWKKELLESASLLFEKESTLKVTVLPTPSSRAAALPPR